MGGRFAAWRAALRIARRDAWRNRGRSALVAVMVALPVFAVSAVSTLYRSTELEPRDVVRVELGTQAQARMTAEPGAPLIQELDGQTWGPATEPGTDTIVDAEPMSQREFLRRAGAVLPPRDRLVPDLMIYGAGGLRVGDRLAGDTQLRELDYTARGLGGLVEQVAGRPPAAAGEVVVSESFRRRYEVGTGGTLTVTRAITGERTPLRVVGVVNGLSLSGSATVLGRPGSGLIEAAIGPPGGDPTGGDATGDDGGTDPAALQPSPAWFVVGPDPVSWDQVLDLNALGGAVTSRAVLADPPAPDRVPVPDQGYTDPAEGSVTAVGVAVVAVGLLLLQIALLAGPAIAVGARRNRRSLAVLAAAGAERRQLRAVVLAGSGVVGLVSCLVAAALGAATGGLVIVLPERYLDQAVPRIDVHPLDLLVLVAIGTFTAVAAAAIPARQAARMNVVAALTGRRERSGSGRRTPVLGLLVAVVGAAVALAGASRHQALPTVIGIALGQIGMIGLTGAAVALAARGAGRLPLAGRFAVRDAARQRARTTPAVAAVMAAIAGGTAALLYVAAQDRYDEINYSPSAAKGVVLVQPGYAQDGGQNGTSSAAAGEAARRFLPVDRVAPLLSVTGAGGETSIEPLFRDGRTGDGTPAVESSEDVLGVPGSGGLVDDGTALALLTGVADPAAAAALRGGRAVVFDRELLWPDGALHLDIGTWEEDGSRRSGRTVVVPAVVSTQSPRLPGYVLPPQRAKALKFDVDHDGVVASTTRMPTTEEEERAAAAVQDATGGSVTVERGYVSQYGLGLLALVVAAALITLGGTFTAVGLAAAESRPDLATLAAVGAGPGLRRRIAASQAGVITGLGAALGVATGFLAGWALIRMRQPVSGAWFGAPQAANGWGLTVPWPHLGIVAVGVPLLAVLIGFVTTRSRLPLVRRLGQ